MGVSLNNIQKALFVAFLYLSAFSGWMIDNSSSLNTTVFYFLYDSIILFLGLTSLSYSTRGLRIILLLFAIVCILNISFSSAPLFSSINGLREFIMIFGLVLYFQKIFHPDNEELAQSMIKTMKTFAFWFLVFQIPVSAYQFIQYGASDKVGGTFGEGGSGILSLQILCLIFFLFISGVKSSTIKLLLMVCLIPLFLNETKISFLLVPLLFIFLYFSPKIKNIIWPIILSVGFFILLNNYYTNQGNSFENNFSEIFSSDYLSGYLLGDISQYDDVPRFTKIFLSIQLLSQQFETLFFGFEFGVFKGGNFVELSPFARNYQWLLSGSRPYLFFLLIQGGVFLVLVFFALIAYLNNFFRRFNRFNSFLLIIFLVILFYNDSLRMQEFAAVYLFMVFYSNSKLFELTKIEE